jgi:hypothetical protein
MHNKNYYIPLGTKGPKSSIFSGLLVSITPPLNLTQLNVQKRVGLRPLGAPPLRNGDITHV